MLRLIFIALFSFCCAIPLISQIWEIPQSKSVEDPKSSNFRTYPIVQRLYLHDFPARPEDGDFITLPGPKGNLIPVQLRYSPVLDKELRKRFPNILAFSFQSDEVSGRLAMDGSGIDIVYTMSGKRYAIEQAGNQLYYLYNLSDYSSTTNDPVTALGKCLTPVSLNYAPVSKNTVEIRRATAVHQRIYDLAVSVTSTYAANHGGTIETILAEVNKVFNRVNEVFIRELSLRFQIIDESTELFFLDSETDPYTEGNNTLMLNKLDELLVKTIGRDHFDLGHLLATNCGAGTAGVSGGIGTICEFNKGKALSCDLTDNLEDYVRVLTHELGHQLGATHTWSNCPGLNNSQRTGSTAYEPGSGSSIMSYINTCGSQNLKYIPGPLYFHTGSIQQMLRYVDIGPGSSCVATEAVANENPEILSTNIPDDNSLYIPIGTPIILKVHAEDGNSDELTYGWDQLNTGPVAPLGAPIQSGPSIRSFAPDTSGARYIPGISTLIQDTQTPGEVIPTYNRDFTFGVTVRDNNEIGGGLVQEIVSFHSTSTAGPFFIDSPNDSTDQLFAGSLAKVQWHVAGTNTGLVNAEFVTIKMSTDRGQTYPYVLAAKTDNDGEEDIQIPNIVSDSVRFFIQGYDHIFFDISDQNIAIINPETPTFGLNITPARQLICLPEQAKVSIKAFPVLGFDEPLTYNLENPYPNVQVVLTDTQTMVNQEIQLTFSVPDSLNSDTLTFQLEVFGSTTDTIIRDISLIVVNNSHSELTLEYPTQDTKAIEVNPPFLWKPSPNADYYNLEVSTSASFSPEFLVLSEPNITADSFPSTTILEEGEIYFWRVLPYNRCATFSDVPVAAFQTKIQDCQVYPAPDLPRGLGASSPGEILSKIDVMEDFEVSDVNVINVKGFHESVNQLKLFLQKDTTAVTLYQGECGIRNLSFNINYDDESVGYTDCKLGSGSRVKPLEPLTAFQGINSQGAWNFHWMDSEIGAGGIFEAWQLELCGSVKIDRLEVISDTLFVIPGGQNPLTENQIKIADGIDVIYEWIDTTQYGQLLKNGEAMRPGQKWTHDDLISGVIQYKNSADFNEEFILISAESSDGRWSGVVRIPVRLDQGVPVNPPQLAGKITIFPNPANSYLSIKTDGEVEIKQVHIRNILGKVLYHHQPGFNTSQWSVATGTWPTGMVFITVLTDDGLWTDKILIH